VYCSVLHCAAMYCNLLQSVAVCCSLLQSVGLHLNSFRTKMIKGMGWLRLVGSIKSWVSFAEHSLFYRALLQKRPVI